FANGSRRSVELRQDGTTQLGNLALLDFEDGTNGCKTALLNTVIEGSVEDRGQIRAISFVVGVPEEKNHVNSTAEVAPLNTSGLWWSWNTGFIFFRTDLITTGMPGGWGVHLGSTECTGNGNGVATCGKPNRPTITLDNFDPAKNAIVLDLKTLLATSNVDVNVNGSAGCHSDTTDNECGPILESLGVTGSQKVFRVGAL
ncbi:MAG: metallo-mystery pair system four-Cys motif protein, partial [Gemmatimonadota bacterium]|nr:metallo-mystery pair system four-Cys motif protein [Gemmatimonadota bacterium]